LSELRASWASYSAGRAKSNSAWASSFKAPI
jgi:hypothetical protein